MEGKPSVMNSIYKYWLYLQGLKWDCWHGDFQSQFCCGRDDKLTIGPGAKGRRGPELVFFSDLMGSWEQ